MAYVTGLSVTRKTLLELGNTRRIARMNTPSGDGAKDLSAKHHLGRAASRVNNLLALSSISEGVSVRGGRIVSCLGTCHVGQEDKHTQYLCQTKEPNEERPQPPARDKIMKRSEHSSSAHKMSRSPLRQGQGDKVRSLYIVLDWGFRRRQQTNIGQLD